MAPCLRTLYWLCCVGRFVCCHRRRTRQLRGGRSEPALACLFLLLHPFYEWDSSLFPADCVQKRGPATAAGVPTFCVCRHAPTFRHKPMADARAHRMARAYEDCTGRSRIHSVHRRYSKRHPNGGERNTQLVARRRLPSATRCQNLTNFGAVW